MGDLIKVIESDSFAAGGAVFSVTAAYNSRTKEARIYAEFERIEQRVFENQLVGLGAVSILIDAFSSSNWEAESSAALKSVIQCGGNPGFSLLRNGVEARAAGHCSSSPEGGPSGASGHEQSAENGQDDRAKRKRQHSPTALGGNHGGMGDSAMEFLRAVMEDANRKNDAVSQLREKVVILESEKRMSVLEVRVAEHANQLAVKDAEISLLLGDKTTAEREASEQRRIAETAATKLREAEQLKVGGVSLWVAFVG